jgi:opacity protein-like surface antigen
MKNALLLVLFACVATASFAQSAYPYLLYSDVVYLKNGSSVKGHIIEQIPNVSLKLQTRDESIFVYRMSEVEKITKEVVIEEVKQSKSGVAGTLDVGYNFGVGKYALDRFSMNFSIGHRSYPKSYKGGYLDLGIGVGMRYFPNMLIGSESQVKGYCFPVFAHLRGTSSDSKASFYSSFDIGYSLPKVGLMQNSTIGVDIKINNQSSFFIGVGYEWQWGDFVNFYNYSVTSENFGAIVIKMGVAF